MDFLIFFFAGAGFILFGYWFRGRHRRFLARCRRVEGRVVGQRVREHRTRRALGSSKLENIVHEPLVEFEHGNEPFRFYAEVDVRQEGLKQGDAVTVMVSLDNPRVARLAITLGQTQLIMVLFMVLGAGAMSLYLLDFTGLTERDVFNPVSVIGGLAVLYLLWTRVVPMLRDLRTAPIYHENVVPAAQLPVEG